MQSVVVRLTQFPAEQWLTHFDNSFLLFSKSCEVDCIHFLNRRRKIKLSKPTSCHFYDSVSSDQSAQYSTFFNAY